MYKLSAAVAFSEKRQDGYMLKHFPGKNRLVCDNAPSDDDFWIRARIRSGDYFLTVATELDQIIQSLASGISSNAVLPELECLVTELIGVNKVYRVVPKT